MKSSTALVLLLLIGAVALLIYGYNNGWFKSAGPVPITTPIATPVTSNDQVITPDTTVITNPDTVQLDHSNDGFVLIPIDSAGNVVQPSRAVQFIKYSSLGQDCNIQYRDRIYFVQSPTRRLYFAPHMAPPAP